MAIFNLNKNLALTEGLMTVDFYNFNNLDKNTDIKIKKQNVKVNAFKLDKKTIIIKGFNEDVDNSLLKTIDLDIKNIDLSDQNILGLSTDIIPVTVDISLNEDVIQLNDDNSADIIEYEVVSGDNISSIADKFNVSVNTIIWANDLNTKSSIKVGQKLVILPVSGVSYKVKNGDTLSGLSKRFNVNERDITGFNKTDGDKLIIGETIIIPGGKIVIKNDIDKSIKDKTIKQDKVNVVSKNDKTLSTGAMIRPIKNGIKTQGIHGNNGVDFGANIGTPIYAVSDGVVTLTRGGDSWNGGYGNYIVIKHNNGVQTLYAHLSVINIDKGQNVNRGQLIGKSGNSGQSTGPHLHFEVRGARNPF